MINIKILKFTLSIFGVALIINAIVLAVATNFNFGIVITAVLGLLFLIYGTYFERINDKTKTGLLKWIKYAILTGLTFLICLSVFFAVYGNIDDVTYKEDALIVLGAGVKGETVTLPLKYRLEKAVEYTHRNPKAIIVVSGSKGFQESISEALAMERYLIKNGVSKDKIIKEEKATSTYENFLYSKKILDNYFKRQYSIAFITNDFHIYRASRLAKITGYKANHCHAKMKWYTIPINYLRECAAVLKLWILRK